MAYSLEIKYVVKTKKCKGSMEGLTRVLAGVGDEVAALTERLPAHDTLVRLFSCYCYYYNNYHCGFYSSL